MAHIVRLFLDQPLAAGQMLSLDRDHAHRLFSVMRLAPGDEVRVFNADDGEWRAHVAKAGKRAGELHVEGQLSVPKTVPDVWLCFAPIKRDRTDFIVEKAAELGVRRIQPILTEFTNSERVRLDRLATHVIAAVEQCGGTFVPEVSAPTKLADLLHSWPKERRVMFCDEAASEGGLPDIAGPWAIFVGPEGGFSEVERAALAKLGHTVSLGPRILRADTAAVAALTLWQSKLGDWA